MMDKTRFLPLQQPDIFLISLIGCNQLLIGWLMFQPVSMQLTGLVLVLAWAIFFVRLIRYFRLVYLLKPLIIIFAGGSGILIGAIVDFGQLGLQTLSSLCIAAESGLNSGQLTRMLVLAPWTHIGMWLSCSIAFLVVDYRPSECLVRHRFILKHAFCFGGMLAGMWFVQILLPGSLFSLTTLSGSAPAGLMWLGMSLGMFASYLLFDALASRKFLSPSLSS